MMSLENAYYAGILPPHAYDEAVACFWSSAATADAAARSFLVQPEPKVRCKS